MINLDQTYCASHDCKNECGRKMTEEQVKELASMANPKIWYGYFCGYPRQYILDDGNKSN